MTLWVSHRGYTEHAIENTAQAFSEARKQGFQVVETDVRISRDGKLILWHDNTVSGYLSESRPEKHTPIQAMSFAELQKIVLSKELVSGDAVQASLLSFDTFAEEFDDLTWTLDIKPEQSKQSIEALCKWWKDRGSRSDFIERTRFLVWSHQDELLLEHLFGQNLQFYARPWACYLAGVCALMHVPPRLLRSLSPPHHTDSLRSGGMTYAVTERLGPFNLFRPALVQHYHDRGARVIAYLPSSVEAHRAAVMAGFDEILTDFECMSFV